MGCISSSMISRSSHRSQVFFLDNENFTKTRILQNEVIDHCIVDQSDSEKQNRLIPTGEFIDGLLGVCHNTAATIEKLSELPPGKLFEDEDFPSDSTSLCLSDLTKELYKDVVWKRPFEISKTPSLFADGISRREVKQGILGNCWFLSACASVGARQDLIEKVIDPSQLLTGEGYCGALLINFWRFGEWVTVNIDDRLPTKNGRLIFGSCTDGNEFWLPMIEKAYAKLHGSYEALIGGHSFEAFIDLTGGVVETIPISPGCFKLKLYDLLVVMHERGALITSSIKSARNHHGECRKHVSGSKGLTEGHTYSVTCVTTVKLMNGETVELVRLRNPWGDGKPEWKGAWNDRSARWNQVSEAEEEGLRFLTNQDGGFWMECEDFQREFEEVTIATTEPSFNMDHSPDASTEFALIKSSWRKSINAGGCRNDLEKFALNPQYLLHLKKSDHSGEKERCCVHIGLMQEHRRSEKNRRLAMVPIAFFVYKADGPIAEKLGAEYFLCIPEEHKSGDFTNSREAILRTDLAPGYYVVIPATFHPETETNFLIRIFSLSPFTLTEIADNKETIREGNNNSMPRTNFY